MFSGAKQLFAGEMYLESSIQEDTIGARGVDQYGDLYRYIKVGGSGITAGQLQTAPTQKTAHHNIAAYAAVTADGRTKKVTLQLGAAAATANEYAGGLLCASDNGPQGTPYRITGHPAADSSATLEVTVDKPFQESIATTDEFYLVHNTWNAIIVNAAFTLPAAGVPLVDMTASYYGWIKTGGVMPVLIGTAATLGADLKADGSGGVTDRTDALGASAEPVVAVANIAVGVAGEYNPVTLLIDR